MTTLENTFARKSNAYAQARPRYPRALFDWLVDKCASRRAAWDCATGNGQAAVDIAPHFAVVQATDLSQEQVAQGLAVANVVYSAQPAESTHFADNTFDLITVAQALHWFDYGKFWPEVARVGKPGALFCAWGYAWFECDADISDGLVMPFRELVAPFWARNNRILWNGYQNTDISFPFERLQAPALTIRAHWSVPQLIEYMQTWSAYKRSRQNTVAAAALDALLANARECFARREPLDLSMPLAIVAGFVSNA